jgi:sugar transferase (PEP-CTERM system associated)
MIRLFGHSIDIPAIVLAVVEFLIIFALVVSLHHVLAAEKYSVSRESPYLSGVLIGGTAVVGMLSVGLYSRQIFVHWSDALSRALVILPLVTLSMLLVIEVYDQWIGVIPHRGNYLLSGLAMLIFTPILMGERRLFVLIVDRTGLFVRRVLVLGTGERPAKIEQLSQRFLYRSLVVVGYVRLSPDHDALPAPVSRRDTTRDAQFDVAPDNLLRLCRNLQIDELVVATDDGELLPFRDLLNCKMAGVGVTDYTSFWERETGEIDLDEINPNWMLFSRGFRMGPLRTLVKRGVDLVIALALLALASPILLLTALTLKVQGGGPLLYRQERVGLHGKTFTIIKFRSMRVDAEKDGPRWAALNDTRITPVGNFIRRTRIDELPQIFNVLKGDMSIVGPRPERPIFVDTLSERIPYYRERHLAKPGITGWAQINYPYGATEKDARMKLAYDLYYIKNRNIFLDVIIILQTLEVLLWNSGAR